MSWARNAFLLGSALGLVAVVGPGRGGAGGQAVIRFSNCLICHLQYEEQLGSGAHGEAGVVCETCHGESRGHLDDEHNDVKPDRIFTNETVPAFCATCHEDAARSYAAAAGRRSGGGRLPACHVCHGAHRVTGLDEAQQTAAELQIPSPHGKPAPPAIKSVAPARKRVAQFEPLFVDVVLAAEHDNPFDPEQIRVDALFSGPAAEALTVPCFYRGGSRQASRWQARFTPSEVGSYSYEVEAEVGGRTATSQAFDLEVSPGARPGLLRPDPDSPFAFTRASGEPFRGIGVSFTDARPPLNAWPRIFRQLSAAGCNLVRIGLTAGDLPVDRGKPWAGRHDFAPARKLDRVIKSAERHGVCIVLAVNGIEGDGSSETVASGVARETHKKRLRYVVARWGYSTSIAAWQAETAADLRQIDPFGRLVTRVPRAPGRSGVRLHRALWRGLFSPTPVLPLVPCESEEDVHRLVGRLEPVARLCREMLADAPVAELAGGSAPTASPPGSAEVLGCRTGRAIYLWVRHRPYETPDLATDLTPDAPRAVVVSVPGMAPGDYAVDWYDTRTGEYVRATEEVRGEDGGLKLHVPPLNGDIAARIRHL